MTDLRDLFAQLPSPEEGENTFSTIPIHDQNLLLGKDLGGRPALLLATVDLETDTTPVELKHILFLPGAPCKVLGNDGKTVSARFSVLRCTATDLELHDYFLRTLNGVVDELDDNGGAQRMADVFEAVVEVFRSMSAVSERAIQGLWCELLVIANAQEPAETALAWHSRPRNLYDFESGSCRLEVKSTIDYPREHRFRLEQVLPRAGSTLLIFSFVLKRDDLGPSIGELWDEISSRSSIDASIRKRISTIITKTVGSDWRRARKLRFDKDAAWKNLELFRAEDVPKVPSDLPTGVSEVQFVADLSGIATLSREQARNEGKLFAAVFGQ